ncbi:hypothetical protein GCM10027082_26190 [Comamonas humi]
MQAFDIDAASRQLVRDGYVVVRGAYPAAAVEQARASVLDHFHLLRNTRPHPASGHLAGFHRYPELAHLEPLLCGHAGLQQILCAAAAAGSMRAIGLSDITVNRSQQWHVDLLRGRYQRYLTADMCWGDAGGGVYKILWYLQDGKSLRVRPGQHLVPIALDDDACAEPGPGADIRAVGVQAGDIVLMDIRLPHRGSSEAELDNAASLSHPKILVSTVVGAASQPLTAAMEAGNAERLRDWEQRNQRHCQPVAA